MPANHTTIKSTKRRQYVAQNELENGQTLEGVEDVNLVAYLVSRGFIAIPYMKESKEGELPRVVWDVQGENVEKARREYYGNASIGVRDFVRSLKEMRTDLYTMRNMGTTNKED
jgi:hypothetical protein